MTEKEQKSAIPFEFVLVNAVGTQILGCPIEAVVVIPRNSDCWKKKTENEELNIEEYLMQLASRWAIQTMTVNSSESRSLRNSEEIFPVNICRFGNNGKGHPMFGECFPRLFDPETDSRC
jgi:hypothetical protein